MDNDNIIYMKTNTPTNPVKPKLTLIQGGTVSNEPWLVNADVLGEVRVLRALGYGPAMVADAMNARHVPAPIGGPWYPSTVQALSKLATAR
jgi:hypothetical protein